MNDEINFCPFCSASQHKLFNCADETYFCKECNKFFKANPVTYSCPKCNSKRIIDSDFPSPDGQVVFQCQSCKKMFSAKDFFAKLEKVKI
jgi:transposase-like protein